MSYRPHPKHARTDPNNPLAWATDDRSGFLFNHEDLVPEFEWGGTNLIDKHVLVGPPYVDIPQEQLRAIVLPPDPDPIINARPEQYIIDEGLMPMVTEAGYPGDPGQVLRDGEGNYIGVEPATPQDIGDTAGLQAASLSDPVLKKGGVQ